MSDDVKARAETAHGTGSAGDIEARQSYETSGTNEARRDLGRRLLGKEQVARGFTERQIRRAAHELRVKLEKGPTREQVAIALHTSEETLKRACKELGMGKRPPAAPED